MNGLSNVVLFDIGLSDRTGTSSLFDIAGENAGLGSFVGDQPKFAEDFNIQHNVRVEQADDILSDVVVDAIKIDVQGYEPNFFAGMQKLLERSRPVVWCEISHETLTHVSPNGQVSFFPYAVEAYKIERVSRFGLYRTQLRKCSRIETFGDYYFKPV